MMYFIPLGNESVPTRFKVAQNDLDKLSIMIYKKIILKTLLF